MREVKEQTAAELCRGGMSGERADEVARRIVVHVDQKRRGEPVPDRFRPIEDSRKR